MAHAPRSHPSSSQRERSPSHARHAWGSRRRIRLLDGSWLQVGEDVEANLRAIGARQHAAAHREQITLAGLGRGALAHRLATKRYELRHPKVVLLDEIVPSPHREAAAALLAVAPDVVLFGVSAAPLWRMLDPLAGREVEILVPRERRLDLEGVVAHRSGRLHRADQRRRNGLLLPAPALTVLQLASDHELSQRLFERAAAKAHLEGLAREAELHAVLDRYPRAPGTRRLRALLTRPGGLGRTRSDVERDLQALIRKASMEMPLTNTMLHGLEVDAYFPRHRLVIEVNTVGSHGSTPSIVGDHERTLHLEARGEHVLPILDEHLCDRPFAVVAALATQLERLAPRR